MLGVLEGMMRRILVGMLFVTGCLTALNSLAQGAQSPAGTAGPGLTGSWLVTVDFFGTPLQIPLELTQQGNKLIGSIGGDKLEGTVESRSVHFVSDDGQGSKTDFTATMDLNGTMSGTIVSVDAADGKSDTHKFTAKRVAERVTSAPKMHEFTPTVFYRQFSPNNAPVLTVSPGDTIHTTTVDAGGKDEKGVSRVLGGNPETGPFYVEGAAPGDTLVVHIVKLQLNRDWAGSDDGIVDRGVNSDLAVKIKDNRNSVRWHLDTTRGVATPEKPGEHMARYSIPLRPMLGCVATSPSFAQAPPGTGDSGGFGGNMDFNEIVDGATIYLPVRVPGAMLYFGDGHAAQGDGELNGNALETSMDVTISVDVIAKKRIGGPRVESATHIMAMGLEGSIDEAFREATSSMAQWLMDDYKLTPSEVAQVLGTSSEYRVSEVADRNAGVVIKISKERLAGLGAGK